MFYTNTNRSFQRESNTIVFFFSFSRKILFFFVGRHCDVGYKRYASYHVSNSIGRKTKSHDTDSLESLLSMPCLVLRGVMHTWHNTPPRNVGSFFRLCMHYSSIFVLVRYGTPHVPTLFCMSSTEVRFFSTFQLLFSCISTFSSFFCLSLYLFCISFYLAKVRK